MQVRPEREIPETNKTIDKSKIAADVAHEESLRYFLEHTELGILDREQMGVMSLVDAVEELGIELPGTKQFFEKQRQLSSGEEGKGRVQAKEVITAGAFPMSLLFGEQKTGWFDTIKSFFGKGKSDTPPQQGMR